MSIVITGASGQLAGGVIAHALQTVDASELLLVTRSPEELSGYAAEGTQVRYGNFEEPGSLSDAFAGGTRMLLISTDAVGARVALHGAAIEAATDAGIELVAYTSIVNPIPDNPAFVVPDHRATEQKLRDSGVGWTFLRNSIYAEYQSASMAAAAESGVLVTNEGSGRVAYVSRDDCAAAAAAVLVEGDHAGIAYDITGPELVDADQRADIFSSVTGKKIEVVHVDDDSYAEGLAAATGMPLEAARGMTSFGAAIRQGHLAVSGNDFEKLTGRKAKDLRSVLAATTV
ncbi:MAG TPA: NAD(P)H-binding protein [Acidimicrobiia bacterium]